MIIIPKEENMILQGYIRASSWLSWERICLVILETVFGFLYAAKIPWRRKLLPTPVFCLGNLAYRGAWQVTIHRVAAVGHSLVIPPLPPRIY